MYTITINNEELTDVEDYAVVNHNGRKTLYVRDAEGEQLGYELEKEHELKIMVKE